MTNECISIKSETKLLVDTLFFKMKLDKKLKTYDELIRYLLDKQNE